MSKKIRNFAARSCKICCRKSIRSFKSYVEYMIQDYDKPMGVATYKTATDMPERLRKALPDQEELLKIIRR